MFVRNTRWRIVLYEEEDQLLHTAENGYCCGDPECVCADAEEADLGPMPQFLPSTWQALRDLRASRQH